MRYLAITDISVLRRIELVEAENARDAAEHAINNCSVLDLKNGVSIRVFELGSLCAKFFAEYDKEPITDGHAATDATLVIKEVV